MASQSGPEGPWPTPAAVEGPGCRRPGHSTAHPGWSTQVRAVCVSKVCVSMVCQHPLSQPRQPRDRPVLFQNTGTGPPAWLTGTLQKGGVRSARSLLRRPPPLASPIATSLRCGRPGRSGLLVLKLLTTQRLRRSWCRVDVRSKATGFGSEPKPNRRPQFQCFPRRLEGLEAAVPRLFFRILEPVELHAASS